jgi:hypothetical protein
LQGCFLKAKFCSKSRYESKKTKRHLSGAKEQVAFQVSTDWDGLYFLVTGFGQRLTQTRQLRFRGLSRGSFLRSFLLRR